MVFLPEAFDYTSESHENAIENAESLDGPTISYYRSLAKQQSVWLSLGGFHEKVIMKSILFTMFL
jgi:predicted amidohydrolase